MVKKTIEEKKEIVAEAERKGSTYAAEKYSVTTAAISRWARQLAGNATAKSRGLRAQMTLDERSEVLEFADKNGRAAAAQHYGVSESTISRWRTEFDRTQRSGDPGTDVESALFYYDRKVPIPDIARLLKHQTRWVRRVLIDNGRIVDSVSPRFDDETKNAAITYAATHSKADTARQFNIAPATLWRWLKNK